MLVAALEGLGGGGLERRAEHRPAVDRAEEGLLVARLDAVEVGERQQAGHPGAVAAQDRDLAGDGDRHGAGIGEVTRDDVVIALGAVPGQRVADEAEAFEGAFRHRALPLTLPRTAPRRARSTPPRRAPGRAAARRRPTPAPARPG